MRTHKAPRPYQTRRPAIWCSKFMVLAPGSRFWNWLFFTRGIE